MTVSAPSVFAAASTSAACSPDGYRVHAADRQPGRIQVRAQAIGVVQHVERLDGAVAGSGDALEDALPVAR